MRTPSGLYRIHQFWNALTLRPGKESFHDVEAVLSPELFELFLKMQPTEQAHSLQVFTKLCENGATNGDLLAAALLHDVGKTVSPLRIWDRVVIVLLPKIFPQKARQWGNEPSSKWSRPFLVAQHHPEWGAELASEAGASELTVALIRRHQDSLLVGEEVNQSTEDQMLALLQVYDDES